MGKNIVLADVRRQNAEAAADVLMDAGYDVSVATVDASAREAVHALVETASAHGDITALNHAAGVPPTQRFGRVTPASGSDRAALGTVLAAERPNGQAGPATCSLMRSTAAHRALPNMVECINWFASSATVRSGNCTIVRSRNVRQRLIAGTLFWSVLAPRRSRLSDGS